MLNLSSGSAVRMGLRQPMLFAANSLSELMRWRMKTFDAEAFNFTQNEWLAYPPFRQNQPIMPKPPRWLGMRVETPKANLGLLMARSPLLRCEPARRSPRRTPRTLKRWDVPAQIRL